MKRLVRRLKGNTGLDTGLSLNVKRSQGFQKGKENIVIIEDIGG